MIPSLNIEPADKSELKTIAAMHIEPESGKIHQIIREHDGQYRFYFDKVKMFFDLEPRGVIVAKQNKQILGLRSIRCTEKKAFR